MCRAVHNTLSCTIIGSLCLPDFPVNWSSQFCKDLCKPRLNVMMKIIKTMLLFILVRIFERNNIILRKRLVKSNWMSMLRRSMLDNYMRAMLAYAGYVLASSETYAPFPSVTTPQLIQYSIGVFVLDTSRARVCLYVSVWLFNKASSRLPGPDH